MPEASVPEKAIIAVAEVIRLRRHAWVPAAEDDLKAYQAEARRLVGIAQPFIAEAERERIRQFAEHHRVMVDMGPGKDPVPFAGLLDGDL